MTRAPHSPLTATTLSRGTIWPESEPHIVAVQVARDMRKGWSAWTKTRIGAVVVVKVVIYSDP